MKTRQSSYGRTGLQMLQRRQGFTLFESFVIVVIIILLMVLIIPALRPDRSHRAVLINCVNNLIEVGIASRIWGDDHGGKHPMDVPVALGGAKELIAAGNVAGCFQVMAKELAVPRILVCPGDARSVWATNWSIPLNRTNISYFLALSLTTTNAETLVSGDDDLVQSGHAVPAGLFQLGTNLITWAKDRHHGRGVFLLPDGAVETRTNLNSPVRAGNYEATNCVVVP
jgi:hypothetical protein